MPPVFELLLGVTVDKLIITPHLAFYLGFHSVVCVFFFLRLRLHRCCFSHLLITVGFKHRCQKQQILQAPGRQLQAKLPFVLRGVSQVRSSTLKVLIKFRVNQKRFRFHEKSSIIDFQQDTHIPISFHSAILTIYKVCAEIKSSNLVKQTIE